MTLPNTAGKPLYQAVADALLEQIRSGQLQANQRVPSESELGERLVGGEVVSLLRVRLRDGEPTAIERAYLPHELCPGILANDFSSASLYQVLAEQYGCRPDPAEQEIEASLATPQGAAR